MAACACQIEPGDAQTFAATPTSVEAQYARQRPDFCRFRLGVRSGANASSLMRFGLAQHCEGLRGMVSRHESHLHRGCEGLRHLRGISRKSSHVGDIEKFRKHYRGYRNPRAMRSRDRRGAGCPKNALGSAWRRLFKLIPADDSPAMPVPIPTSQALSA